MVRDSSRLLFVLSLAWMTACAGAGPDPANTRRAAPDADSYAEAPSWVKEGCRAHWPDEAERKRIVCGIGSAPPNRNRVAARETAVTRARSAIARSIEVTIESLVRLEDRDGSATDGDLREIVHQLSSASLPGCQVESIWRSESGEVHALVSLQVARVQQSVRHSSSLSPATREDLARRAADAFAQMEAAFDSGGAGPPDGGTPP
jgi:hypothetical protein